MFKPRLQGRLAQKQASAAIFWGLMGLVHGTAQNTIGFFIAAVRLVMIDHPPADGHQYT